MSKSQYVFVTSKSKMQVIDTAILHYLETEEYENASLIDNALMSAVVAGVDFDTAVSRLTEKGILSVVDVPELKK